VKEYLGNETQLIRNSGKGHVKTFTFITIKHEVLMLKSGGNISWSK
jgi:hypothetical protein